jgi:hypothetical protein
MAKIFPASSRLFRGRNHDIQAIGFGGFKQGHPRSGLQEGDLGAVVHVYEPDGLEVEFVRALGRTQAVVALKQDDVRAISDTDLIAVRRLDRPA